MTSESQRIEHLFDTAEARFDDWRDLLKASQLWASRVGTKEATRPEKPVRGAVR